MIISDFNLLETAETANVIGGGYYYKKHDKGCYEEPSKDDWWKKPGQGQKHGFCPPAKIKNHYQPCYKKD